MYSNSSVEHPPSSPHLQKGALQHATLCTSGVGLLQRVARKLQPLQASRSLRSRKLPVLQEASGSPRTAAATVPTYCPPLGLHQQTLESRAWLWQGAYPTTLLAGCVRNLSSPRGHRLLPGPSVTPSCLVYSRSISPRGLHKDALFPREPGSQYMLIFWSFPICSSHSSGNR